MSGLKHYLTFKLCSAENKVEVVQQTLSAGLTGKEVKKPSRCWTTSNDNPQKYEDEEA